MMTQSRRPNEKTEKNTISNVSASKPAPSAIDHHDQIFPSNAALSHWMPTPSAPFISSPMQQTQLVNPSVTSSAVLSAATMQQFTIPSVNAQQPQPIPQETIIASPPAAQDSIYIRKADLVDVQPSKFAEKVASIFNSFNLDKKTGNPMPSFVTQSDLGTQIKPDEFRLVSVNNIPQLISPADGATVFIDWALMKGVERTDHGVIKQNEPLIIANSRFIVNVKKGQMAKAYIGVDKRPIILDEGTHIISSPQFELEKEHTYVNRYETHIQHGPIHILNIPDGKLAKVIEANRTYKLLSPGRYEFNDFGFRLADQPFVDSLSEYIQHGTLHILNIPDGFVAKVIEKGVTYRLLPAGHHEFTDAGFKLVGNLVHSLEPYIEHGIIHVLNVPQGYMAKIVENGFKYRLLEAGHHEFMDAGFALHKHDATKNQLFVRTTEKSISHGPIHRFMPDVTEVALVRKNNHIEVYKSRSEGAYLIDDPTFSTPEFFNTNYRRIDLPSNATKTSMKAKYPNFPDAVNYQEFVTKDRIAIGIKMHIRYSFENIKTAIEKIGLSLVDMSIEDAVVSALSNQIYDTNWNDMQTVTNAPVSKTAGLTPAPNIVNYINTLRDTILGQLQSQFSAFGIHIDGLFIEAPKNLNNEVQQQLETSAKETAKLQAELARLASETEVDRAHAKQAEMKAIIAAEQAAKIAKIQQDQKNEIQTSQAEMERMTAEAKAAAIRAAADAEKYKDTTAPVVAANKSALLQAENENKLLSQQTENAKTRTELLKAKAMEALAELELAKVQAEITKLKADTDAYAGMKQNEVRDDKWAKRGRRYTEFPVLPIIKVEKARATAMRSTDKMIVTPEAAQGIYVNGLFGAVRTQQVAQMQERALMLEHANDDVFKAPTGTKQG